MKKLCPICGSELIYERVDDGTIRIKVEKDGTLTEEVNDSDGYTRIYCSKDYTHEIPVKLQDTIMLLIECAS